MPCVWQPENTEAFTLPLDKKKEIYLVYKCGELYYVCKIFCRYV